MIHSQEINSGWRKRIAVSVGSEELVEQMDSTNSNENRLREVAYNVYVAKTKRDFPESVPHPYSSFQWEDCCLCGNVIVDDPYGHNPYPLCEDEGDARCCGKCNQTYVVPTRIILIPIPEEKARAMAKQMTRKVRADFQLKFLKSLVKAVNASR